MVLGHLSCVPWDGDNGNCALADMSVATCNGVSVECPLSSPHFPCRYSGGVDIVEGEKLRRHMARCRKLGGMWSC
jgi:hypothetical protein